MASSFIKHTKQSDYPHLQLEAASILTLIANGPKTNFQKLIGLNVIPLFVKLLKSEYKEILRQAINFIGSIT